MVDLDTELELFEETKPVRRVLLSRPFRRIGKAVPKKMVDHFDTKLKYAGIRRDPRVWIGIRLLFAFLIAGVFLFAFLIIRNPYPTLVNVAIALGWWLLGFALSLVVFYLLLYFKITDRTTALEKRLPDFLMLTVSNLRAGMTPFSSFIRAARPEFGALHDEVSNIGGRVENLGWMWNYAAGIAKPDPDFDNEGLALIPPRSALWLDCYGRRVGPDPMMGAFDTHRLCKRMGQLDHQYGWLVLNWKIAIREMAISGSDMNPAFRDKKLLKVL